MITVRIRPSEPLDSNGIPTKDCIDKSFSNSARKSEFSLKPLSNLNMISENFCIISPPFLAMTNYTTKQTKNSKNILIEFTKTTKTYMNISNKNVYIAKNLTKLILKSTIYKDDKRRKVCQITKKYWIIQYPEQKYIL